MRAPKCDGCGRRIRPGHHEAPLLDLETGQRIGTYHARCQGAVAGYLTPGAVLGMDEVEKKVLAQAAADTFLFPRGERVAG